MQHDAVVDSQLVKTTQTRERQVRGTGVGLNAAVNCLSLARHRGLTIFARAFMAILAHFCLGVIAAVGLVESWKMRGLCGSSVGMARGGSSPTFYIIW